MRPGPQSLTDSRDASQRAEGTYVSIGRWAVGHCPPLMWVCQSDTLAFPFLKNTPSGLRITIPDSSARRNRVCPFARGFLSGGTHPAGHPHTASPLPPRLGMNRLLISLRRAAGGRPALPPQRPRAGSPRAPGEHVKICLPRQRKTGYGHGYCSLPGVASSPLRTHGSLDSRHPF